MGQIILGTFINENGLLPYRENRIAWTANERSGIAQIGSPQSGIFGVIQSKALEIAPLSQAEFDENFALSYQKYSAVMKEKIRKAIGYNRIENNEPEVQSNLQFTL